MGLYCQECGKDMQGPGKTFYGNVICSDVCQKSLAERVYFRDDPPEPGSTWYCPHCGGENPLADPKLQMRPNCTECGKPLDPTSSAPPKKKGCLVVVMPMLAAAAWWLA